jgi:metal-dependent hydrolase (beta-lactamase superfamily II)
MKHWSVFLVVWWCLTLSGCSFWIFGEKKADHVIGMRYLEENVRSEMPVYASPEDVEPREGDVIVKPGLFARLNPFASSDDDEEELGQPIGAEDDDSVFRRFLPF